MGTRASKHIPNWLTKSITSPNVYLNVNDENAIFKCTNNKGSPTFTCLRPILCSFLSYDWPRVIMNASMLSLGIPSSLVRYMTPCFPNIFTSNINGIQGIARILLLKCLPAFASLAFAALRRACCIDSSLCFITLSYFTYCNHRISSRGTLYRSIEITRHSSNSLSILKWQTFHYRI